MKPKSATPENYFILVTGVPIKNMKELANALENMNGWVFSHHVNDSRNDFANWTKIIMKEYELAEEMEEMMDPKEMEMLILKHLVNKYM